MLKKMILVLSFVTSNKILSDSCSIIPLKLRRKLSIILMLCLLILTSSCKDGSSSGTDGSQNDSTEEVQIEQTEDGDDVQETVDVDGLCLRMQAGSDLVYKNGEEITLEHALFFENEIVYVPLQELVELRGGTVEYIAEDQSMKVQLPASGVFRIANYQIWVDQRILAQNGGEAYYVYDSPHPEPEPFYPILRDGIVYVPFEYLGLLGFGSFWNPNNDRMTISTMYEEKSGVGDFIVGADFALLDASVQSRFQPTGTIEYNYQGQRYEVYSDGELELSLGDGSDLVTRTEASRDIGKIEVTSDRYCTDRGLRVGDSEERYLGLYGDDDTNFQVELTNGVVTKLIFLNNGFFYGTVLESQVGVFSLAQDFNLLSEDVKNQFSSSGITRYERWSCKTEVYSSGGLELVLSTGAASYNEPVTDRIINEIIMISDQYTTERGLQVGNSEEKLLSLYGDEYEKEAYGTNICVEINDGKITKIILYCRA